MRIAGASLNQTPLDWSGNLSRILEVIKSAKAQGVQVLAFPELCISGYGCEDSFFAIDTSDRALDSLLDIIDASADMVIVVSLPMYYAGSLYNVAAVVQDKQLLGLNAKKNLPRDGIHYEPRWFRSWEPGRVVMADVAGSQVPFGDIYYDLGGIGMGIEICEEAWSKEPAISKFAPYVDLVINSSASHFGLERFKVREQICANSSRAFKCTYLYSNLVGLESGRAIYDGSVLIAERGRVMARGKRFSMQNSQLTLFDADVQRSRLDKMREFSVQGKVTTMGLHQDYSQAPYRINGRALSGKPRRSSGSASPNLSSSPIRLLPEQKLFDRKEELLKSVALGLLDYLRKAKAGGYVVSLSGGRDSAACAVLVAQMFALGLEEYGAQELSAHLGLAAPEVDPERPQSWCKRYLHCVYQKTKQSSTQTEKAARALAEELGASFRCLDVQPIVDQYVHMLEESEGLQLDWQKDDLTLQNIQARVRAPSAWMLANLYGCVLISTSNRSEGSVGYTTMDGDSAGGLAPIAGISKAFLSQWLVWSEKSNPHGLGPIGSLGLINELEPTAELRPLNGSDAAQTDERDLMPYTVLDVIERGFVHNKLSSDQIMMSLRLEFPGIEAAQLRQWLDLFYQKWSQSQWKRERLAMSFHLDDYSVDPKTCCRYPVLSHAPTTS